MAEPMTQEWLDLVDEDIVDPEQPIVDPHHHLWPVGSGLPYGLTELTVDTTSGHHIERTVFVECHAAYRTDGPAHLAPIGETEFVAGEALRDPNRLIGGIVAHADLTDGAHLDEVLGAHETAGRGLFRGIRHAGSHAIEPEVLRIPGRAPAGLYANSAFRAGVAELGARGLTYDTWHYHYQNRDYADLARAVPGTTMVLDHFGTPLGVGQFAGKRDEIFQQWKADIVDIAKCPNVVAKLGGLAMPDNGFGWDRAERPPTSDEFVAAQAPYYLHAIECFGPDRCMFESNFPVDRWSLSYKVLWNALKKIAAPFSPTERDAMFRDTATRVYRLGL
jgi:predicted TIM-barrel fold metal-dependent hydrolase